MKRIILIYGLLSGLLCSIWMAFAVFISMDDMMNMGMVFGFATMILAFSFIFVAIVKYRNNYNEGVISFGKAFSIGALIALIASTMYVITWMIDYHFFVPDFFEKYTEAYIKKLQAAGKPQAEIDEVLKNMQKEGVMYKNNAFYRIAFTYLEILPVGILISLIAALILKRKTPKVIQQG